MNDAKGIVRELGVPSGLVLAGNEPQPKTRVFRLFNPTAQDATATLDLLCLADRTGSPIDEIGLVRNTATATSTTVDPDPADNTASATFVVVRAAGSAAG